MPAGPADLLLQEYLACAPDRAEQILETLLVEHALPAVRSIVRHKLSYQGAAEAQDVEDIASEVLLDLIGRLRALRDGSAAGISGFAGYAAVAAFHACHEYLRRKYPARYRLKTRLRYLLNREKRLAIWEDANGEWLCGLPSWRSPARRAIQTDAADPRLAGLPRGSAVSSPAETLLAVFQHLEAPVELDSLVDIMAVLWSVSENTTVPISGAELESPSTGAAREIDLQRWVRQLWEQIRELPRAQRIALLLNLRAGTSNTPALALLPLTGLATVREIAVVLGMEAAELAGLWNSLPLDDLHIAALLGVTRQQVINYRKSARDRLTRRLFKSKEDRPW